MWHHRILSVCFCIVILVGTLIYPPSTAHSQAPPALEKSGYAIITAADSPISLWDGPSGTMVADVVRVGALVQIDQIAGKDHPYAYFVHSVTDRTRRGWVSGEVLKSVVGVRNHIGNVNTCSESPTRAPICGTSLPLTETDALMLHFDYYGVERTAYLQWVITVGNEHYSSRLVKLERTEGASVLNLLDMEMLPHRYSGQWRISIYISGQKVLERGMTILAPPPPATPAPMPTPTVPRPTEVPRPWQSESALYLP